MAYWRLHYHLIWATYDRLHLLNTAREHLLREVIADKCRELGLILHAMGNIEDHVHVVVSIPPKLSVAECLKHFKGTSSRAMNRTGPEQFKWQDGYGALSLSGRVLDTVIKYALNQRQHHANHTATAIFEQITDEDDGPEI